MKRMLTERGEINAEKVGRHLNPLIAKAPTLFTSTRARSIQTGAIISHALKIPPSMIVESREMRPEAGPEEMGREIASYPPEEDVIVVGHMPSIGEYASFLLSSDATPVAPVSFITCAVACLEGDNPDKRGGFSLVFFHEPSMMK